MAAIPTPAPVSETEFGILIQTIRKRLGVPLRRFCAQNGLDAGNYSKMERGLRPAPKSQETRHQLAALLGLKPQSEEWQQFMDLADLSNGQVPQDLMDDAAIASKLPLVFRSLRGDPVTDEQLQELAEMVRSTHRAEPDAADDTLFASAREGGDSHRE